MDTYKILIGATGSVASLKIPTLINLLYNFNTKQSNLTFEVIFFVYQV